MKKRFLLMGAALVLVAATAVGGSLAAGQIEGDRAVGAPLAATTLQIGWADGQTRSPAAEYQLTQPVMPGDTVALADATGKAGVYSVQNTGSVAAYVRVTVTKYWADEENNGKRTDLDGSAIQVSAPAGSGWLESNPPFSSGETQTFYFCRPISPQEASEALLQSLAVDAALGNEYTDKTIRLEAVAEGVQFAGAAHGDVNQKGILTSWGVLAQLDEDGNITAIEQ
ncbi:hypothetical protein LJB68_11330 [bacterium 210820-DFI.6.52]|uniref:Uncharacterized protein n=1 Tax=Bittarella massiliensis (ex Durand et al. 2017) TaxID=1720313 RepID=A0AAQ1MD77_9FIRM|nr:MULTISPECIES: hypothetical protein [Eubacteriales]MCB5942138.1 hypothetical protein [bacterium 210820-DFI.6.52]ERI98804.1 hypothetical protein HMPREF0262_02497 [Clostridium sp. ATCC 29733]MZL69956.1 hypothetical protein [Bittarella massiliensis (ex Durand et al. 2017)]MZL80646.1 hypothetical protein [Bittarella massiliensis (ex Durand et al. 2017)]SHG00806.1 hypothetical protein SAMN05444424_1129 [Bittarella massiliensis (ex Durand et al. 2017)]